MEIQYQNINLRAKTRKLIEQANEIINEYQEQGFDLTVRQIYYQFVARGLMPNTNTSYGYIDRALNRGRMCGLIDWEAIVDRTRMVYSNSHWDSPKEILESAAEAYKIDTRSDQSYYIEVWVEKNALLGVIEPICKKLDITYLPCIGYYSLSSMWRASLRLLEKGKQEGRKVIILHLGDHDPSGLDMTRDIRDRLHTFWAINIEVRRIALNMDQIEEYNPPPNPTKLSDSRSGDYMLQFGEESWELDALPPDVISNLIKKNVNDLTDESKLEAQIRRQEDHRDELYEIARNYEDDD